MIECAKFESDYFIVGIPCKGSFHSMAPPPTDLTLYNNQLGLIDNNNPFWMATIYKMNWRSRNT